MINNIIKIKMDNGVILKVNRNNICISQYELQEHFEDLFKFKKSYKKLETIRLSTICDCMFDVIFFWVK